MEKMSSKYIILGIFDYIKNKKFMYKLFNYSKKYQNKVNIGLFDYHIKYIKQRINIDDYLFNNNSKKSFDVLKEDLLKNKIKNFNLDEFIFKYFKQFPDDSLKMKYKDKIIYINSPLIEILSETNIFEEINIYTDINYGKFNKNDYISYFNKLNSIDSNYTSLIFDNIRCDNCDNYDLNTINNEFNINFNHIKRLIFYFHYSNSSNYFLKSLFSIDIKNTLIELNIQNKPSYAFIDYDLFKELNNFKSLKNLNLIGFHFKNTSILKLKNLKTLNLKEVFNISFENDCFFNLKLLSLSNCKIQSNSEIYSPTFPILEEFHDNIETIKQNQDWKLLIDYKSMINLKVFEGEVVHFLKLENPLLETVYLKNYESRTIETEQLVIEKILSIKTLKNVKIKLYALTPDIMARIQSQNNSIKELQIIWKNINLNCQIFNLQEKFPNCTKLILSCSGSKRTANLDIKENVNNKINEIIINNPISGNIGFYIQSYESLKNININIRQIIQNKNDLPFFSAENKVIFKSLNNFELIYNKSNLLDCIYVNNLFNNIDNMPNLRRFIFHCCSDITDDFYRKIIIKLLSLNLDYIELKINGFYYSEKYLYEELKEICPLISLYNYEQINIYKNI